MRAAQNGHHFMNDRYFHSGEYSFALLLKLHCLFIHVQLTIIVIGSGSVFVTIWPWTDHNLLVHLCITWLPWVKMGFFSQILIRYVMCTLTILTQDLCQNFRQFLTNQPVVVCFLQWRGSHVPMTQLSDSHCTLPASVDHWQHQALFRDSLSPQRLKLKCNSPGFLTPD